VTKDSAAGELVAAVRKVAGGGAYVTASLAERVVQQLNGGSQAPRHAQLSNRELEVLRRIVAGQRLTDIAEQLHLSIKTVSTHKSRIQEKLQLPSMAALIRYGLEHHIDRGEFAGGLDST
jgi:DNA-binding NarL/FixJ family response regulator